jgi:CRISPR/Cas system CSM-associated protein Csm2 small subunit
MTNSLTSSQTILNDLLEYERKSAAPNLSPSKFFELFCAEQILKNFGLSYEELESGIVDDKGGDGGVDSIYTFVNGLLVTEESEFENIRESLVIRICIIQSKNTYGFGEDAILKLERTTNNLLDISNADLTTYKKIYNQKLLRSAEIFRKTYKSIMAQMPELQFSYYYATKGDHIHPNLDQKVKELQDTVKKLYTHSKVTFNFVGAEDLLSKVRKSREENLTLEIEQALPITSGGAICLVTLRNYFNFIQDETTGDLRGWLFEENVRDYEGKNIEVNKAIRETLSLPVKDKEFWWLNNGITIVSSTSSLSSNILSLVSPKVVNGLQTSTEIYNFYRSNENKDDRTILIRVIDTVDEKLRNEIIKATNSQSAIKPASLKAFDEVHYNIEQYLFLHGWYYERRKNFYKNQHKSKDRIISISYMAQSVAAIMLQRPNDSRGRPISLIKNETVYKRIFNDTLPIEIYLECVRFMKSIEAFLNSDDAPEYVQGHTVNVRFHLAMYAAAIKAKRQTLTPAYIQKNGLKDLDTKFLKDCLEKIWKLMQKTKKKMDVDEDRVSKSPDFDEKLKILLKESLHPKLF